MPPGDARTNTEERIKSVTNFSMRPEPLCKGNLKTVVFQAETMAESQGSSLRLDEPLFGGAFGGYPASGRT